MVVEKGQEVIIIIVTHTVPSKCFHESRYLLWSMEETNGLAISGSRIDGCLRFIEEGGRLEKKGAPVVVEGRRRVERDIRKGEI